jgi:VanZ family protein
MEEFLWGFLTFFSGSFTKVASRDFVVNVVFFIPMGVLLYCACKSPHKSSVATILLAAVVGSALSFAIELGQVFFARFPAASDVFANTLGSTTGAFAASFCPIRVHRSFERMWDKVVTSKVSLAIIVMYGTIPLVLSVVESPWPNFWTWNSKFSFQIGNEATLHYPWLGQIYRVAIYTRALSTPEIVHHYQLGFSTDTADRLAKDGLVALYTFAPGEGATVHDVSTFGAPLDLDVAPRSHVRWLHASNGVEIVRPAIIQSRGPATKLADAFRGGAALTVETWITPGNLTQRGPARIVSFASGRSVFILRGTKENFMLGQEGVKGIFQLRTLLSGRGGSPESLQTREGLTRQPLHLVATYIRGIERFFVNGQQTAMLDITKDVIIAFGARKTSITQIAYIVFYFLPVSVFLSAFLSVRVPGLIKVLLIVVAAVTFMVALTEIFQAFLFNRAVDYSVLAYTVIISATGFLTGAGVLPTRIAKHTELACLPGDG